MKFVVFLAVVTCVVCTPVGYEGRRDILGLLGGDEVLNTVPPSVTMVADVATARSSDSHPTAGTTTFHSLSKSTSTTSITQIAYTVSRTGSLSTQTTGSAFTKGNDTPYSPNSTRSITEVTEEAPSTPAAELTEWKVIGISIICITFIGIVIVLITFFDNWWGFIKDIIRCAGKRGGGEEKFLSPDWKRRTWEVKLANEDGHRYPTMSSLESIARSTKDRESRDHGIVFF